MKHLSSPLLSQFLLQPPVLPLVVAGDGDDNDEHQDQQPPGSSPHNDHLHVLSRFAVDGRTCGLEERITVRWTSRFALTRCVVMTGLCARA